MPVYTAQETYSTSSTGSQPSSSGSVFIDLVPTGPTTVPTGPTAPTQTTAPSQTGLDIEELYRQLLASGALTLEQFKERCRAYGIDTTAANWDDRCMEYEYQNKLGPFSTASSTVPTGPTANNEAATPSVEAEVIPEPAPAPSGWQSWSTTKKAVVVGGGVLGVAAAVGILKALVR